jgi:hypothetical protein
MTWEATAENSFFTGSTKSFYNSNSLSEEGAAAALLHIGTHLDAVIEPDDRLEQVDVLGAAAVFDELAVN